MFPHGAVLKIGRDQTPDDIRREMDAVKRLGLNIVVVWPAVYWWEDPTLPEYPYHTGQQILEYAEQIGLKVIMELAGQITALEYAPDSVMKPDYYCTRPDGTPDNRKPYYDTLNYNHPEVKQLIEKQFRAAAQHYKDYPALYGYDIWNETMFSSYDPYTIAVFRGWLRAKYGTLERLNHAWDRHFTEWNQVTVSTWLWSSVMPYVDWQQFRKDHIGMILREWRGIVRSVDPNHPCIADNIHAMIISNDLFDRPHDDWVTAASVDEYGISFYPKNDEKGMPPFTRCLTFTFVQSATPGGRFWISEMQTNHRFMFTPESRVEPHHLKWWNWEAIAHGARGLIYWKWSPFTQGWQMGGRGLVNRRGEYTPRAEEVERLGRAIGKQERFFETFQVEQPRVAILYDRLNHDFTRALTLGIWKIQPIYNESLAQCYKSLWDQNIPARFVTPQDIIDGNLDGIRLLFVTNQLNMNDALADGLKRFVERGGTLFVDGKWGEMSDDGVLIPDTPGGALNPHLGYYVEDIDPGIFPIHFPDGTESIKLLSRLERHLLTFVDDRAQVIARFSDGVPAMLETALGAGRILYTAAHVWFTASRHLGSADMEIEKFMAVLNRRFDLALHTVSDNRLKICAVRTEDALALFIFNYESEALDAEITLDQPPEGAVTTLDLYSDETIPLQRDTAGRAMFAARLEPRDVRVFYIAPPLSN